MGSSVLGVRVHVGSSVLGGYGAGYMWGDAFCILIKARFVLIMHCLDSEI